MAVVEIDTVFADRPTFIVQDENGRWALAPRVPVHLAFVEKGTGRLLTFARQMEAMKAEEPEREFDPRTWRTKREAERAARLAGLTRVWEVA